MQKRRLVVRPADVWHQPDFKDMHQLAVDERVEQNVLGTVLMLNDDCLLNVLKYLPMADLLRAERACWRFRSVAEMIYKTHKVFDPEPYQTFSILQLRSLLYNVGPYVQHLHIKFYLTNRNVQALRFAAQYCTHVTELHLSGIEVSYKIKNLQNLFRHLTKLEMEACSITDQSLIYLMRLAENQSIAELNLSSNIELTGKCLSAFHHVRVANLSGCREMQCRYVHEFIKWNQALEDLNIVSCEGINSECVQVIAKLPALRKLAMSNGYAKIASAQTYTTLRQLKTLTHLKIAYVHFGEMDGLLLELSREVPLQFLDLSAGLLSAACLEALLHMKTLRGLVLSRMKNCDNDVLLKIAKLRTLEEFSIASCHDVTDEGVAEVVRLNPRMRLLNLISCQYLTPTLITLLLKETKDRPQVLTVRVGGASVAVFEDEGEYGVDGRMVERKVSENLNVCVSSPVSSYPGSSDEASSDELLDEYGYWGQDYDEASDYDDSDFDDSEDGDLASRVVLELLRNGF